MPIKLCILNGPLEQETFWKESSVTYFNGNFSGISLVVYPTYTDSRNTLLLKAHSSGIPIITIIASRLHPSHNTTFIDYNKYEEFKKR